MFNNSDFEGIFTFPGPNIHFGACVLTFQFKIPKIFAGPNQFLLDLSDGLTKLWNHCNNSMGRSISPIFQFYFLQHINLNHFAEYIVSFCKNVTNTSDCIVLFFLCDHVPIFIAKSLH